MAGALPTYFGTRDALVRIFQDEGWRALYAGIAPALLGAGAISVSRSFCMHRKLCPTIQRITFKVYLASGDVARPSCLAIWDASQGSNGLLASCAAYAKAIL